MSLDTIVFDIETQNFFTDPGVGRDNFGALRISVVCAYSYLEDRYYSYEEHEMDKLAELFAGAKRIVGFSMNRYDIPVLTHYFRKLKGAAPDLWTMERVDLLQEIELAAGHRIGLAQLAEANLGATKTHHGSEAGTLYDEGKIEELKEYCMNDVKLTKELYDLYRTQHFLLIPRRGAEGSVKIEFAKPTGAAETAIV